MKHTKNSSGFTLVEALLIILIVAILGFAGYYVWHSQKTSDKTVSTSSTAASTTKKDASASSTPNQPAPDPSQKALTITEWGVTIGLRDADKVTYTYVSQPNGSSYGSSYDSNIEINIDGEQAADVVFRSTQKPVSEDVNGKPSVDSVVQAGGYYYWTQGAYDDAGVNATLNTRVHKDLANIQPI